MTEQLPLTLGSVTAPRWENDPVSWACWYLSNNPHVYRTFRRLCDDALKRNPHAIISADMVLHVIRWETSIKGAGDVFRINNLASALFSRLYALDRPKRKGCFRIRKSIFDMLTPDEERRLMNAFEGVRINKRRFV